MPYVPATKTRGEHGKSSAQRGYDRVWRRFRHWYLGVNPLCQDCLLTGRSEPAVDVHHLVKIKTAPHLRLEPTNVMGLCKRCHAVRTARGE